MSAELPRPFGGGYWRFAMVCGGAKLRIPAGLLYVVRLRGYRRSMPLACECFLLRCWAGNHASVAAVIAHTVYSRVVVDNGCVVDVSDVRNVHIRHGAVVEKAITVPPSTHEAFPEITEPIVDTAVKTHTGSPIAVIKHERSPSPSPVGRSPKEPRLGSQHPCSRNPIIVIAIVVPRPIPWGPDVAFSRAKRLLVNGEGRRTETDRDAYLSKGCA